MLFKCFTVCFCNFTLTHLLMLPRRVVSEIDIPGSSLQARDPSQLQVPELKRWLQCRAASTRADLVGRYLSSRIERCCIFAVVMILLWSCSYCHYF